MSSGGNGSPMLDFAPWGSTVAPQDEHSKCPGGAKTQMQKHQRWSLEGFPRLRVSGCQKSNRLDWTWTDTDWTSENPIKSFSSAGGSEEEIHKDRCI